MRVKISSGYGQAIAFILGIISVFSGCTRTEEEIPVQPPATNPLSRSYIGWGVVTGSFTHLLDNPGAGGVSQSYLRRGTVVRIMERRSLINRGNPEMWILVEGNYLNEGTPSQGWLRETSVETYENEGRARTASQAMNL